jgi:hypothetical protein
MGKFSSAKTRRISPHMYLTEYPKLTKAQKKNIFMKILEKLK